MTEIPIIGSKKRTNVMIQQLVIQIKRDSIEGKTEEEIQETIMQLLANTAPQILEEAMRFKLIWERETEVEEKFFGKGETEGH